MFDMREAVAGVFLVINYITWGAILSWFVFPNDLTDSVVGFFVCTVFMAGVISSIGPFIWLMVCAIVSFVGSIKRKEMK